MRALATISVFAFGLALGSHIPAYAAAPPWVVSVTGLATLTLILLAAGDPNRG